MSAKQDEADTHTAFEGKAMVDQKLRDEVAHLRGLTSEDAFQWILQHHPVLPRCIAHRSWAVREQYALLERYLRLNRPFASQKGYDWLLKATSVTRFVRHISARLLEAPLKRPDLELLVYYLRPALKQAARTKRQDEEVSALFAQIEAISEINSLP